MSNPGTHTHHDPNRLSQVINNLDPQLPSNLVNNAIWATGELVQQIKVEGMDAKVRLPKLEFILIHTIFPIIGSATNLCVI